MGAEETEILGEERRAELMEGRGEAAAMEEDEAEGWRVDGGGGFAFGRLFPFGVVISSRRSAGGVGRTEEGWWRQLVAPHVRNVCGHFIPCG